MRAAPPRATGDAVALSRVDFVDLRLVLNVAAERSMTRGAELSALSLPAASMRVKSLEDTFAITIFHRGHRGISLTPAGEAFVQHARVILRDLDRMRTDLREYASGIKGHLRLFANTTATTSLLPKVLPAFLTTHPHVDIELREAASGVIVQALQEGAADVGVVSSHVGTHNLATFPYYVDKMVLVTPIDHPLARRRSASFLEALEHDFVGGRPDSALNAFVAEIALASGKKLKQRIAVGTFDEMCHLIEKGIGVGVLPLFAVSAARRRVKVIDIEDAWSVQPLKICVRDPDRLPEFAKAFVDFLVSDAASAATALQPG